MRIHVNKILYVYYKIPRVSPPDSKPIGQQAHKTSKKKIPPKVGQPESKPIYSGSLEIQLHILSLD